MVQLPIIGMVTTAVLVPAWHAVHGIGMLTHLCVRGEGVVWGVCGGGDECVCVVYMRGVCVCACSESVRRERYITVMYMCESLR